ncbi:Gp19/Gp15/Gp42 family protein [Ruminococcus albus]|uniref:Gp19/Gp15/Gp42 family protein n=1 Tax=Ruminococcus albus TaxID=1264 RepID=UPI00048E5EFA|nr:Gp19/Gp15/Gp42 family protein [Ruminococcus albus]
MGADYAAVSDITALGVTLTPQQEDAAEVLITQSSAKLRLTAKKYGKDIDTLIAADDDFGIAVKNVVVQSVIRALNSIADDSPAAVQATQSALGYSASMTYLNAGQSLYFLRNELKDLGLMQQTYGALEVYD